ncbi:MAG: hypothetical protein Q8P84_07955 [Deltaproteobacteria bacterium]|nr:hypothetical protein [Deltaproteobacteria bacterium]
MSRVKTAFSSNSKLGAPRPGTTLAIQNRVNKQKGGFMTDSTRFVRREETKVVEGKLFRLPYVEDQWKTQRSQKAKTLGAMSSSTCDKLSVGETDLSCNKSLWGGCEQYETVYKMDNSKKCNEFGNCNNENRVCISREYIGNEAKFWVAYQNLNNIHQDSRFLRGDDNVYFTQRGKESSLDLKDRATAQQAARLLGDLKTLNLNIERQPSNEEARFIQQVEAESKQIEQAIEVHKASVARNEKVNQVIGKVGELSPDERNRLLDSLSGGKHREKQTEQAHNEKPNFYAACAKVYRKSNLAEQYKEIFTKTWRIENDIFSCMTYLETQLTSLESIQSKCKNNSVCTAEKISRLATGTLSPDSGWGDLFDKTAMEFVKNYVRSSNRN